MQLAFFYPEVQNMNDPILSLHCIMYSNYSDGAISALYVYLSLWMSVSRWWCCSLYTSTSPACTWWRSMRTGRRTPASPDVSRRSPSPRRSSSPSPPTRTQMYDFRMRSLDHIEHIDIYSQPTPFVVIWLYRPNRHELFYLLITIILYFFPLR